MGIFYDRELTFAESYAPKVDRILKVSTSAAVTSVNASVTPSAGVFSFENVVNYTDRFIVWRANGQQLTLEERSICKTVKNSSMRIDFLRATIVPGTSINVVDDMICIVVPTQSTIHRFCAPILEPDVDSENIVDSVLSQIDDYKFLTANHTSYLLTTPGQAVRAAVVNEGFDTKVAYCMADGKLVVASLGRGSTVGPQGSETVYKEGTLFSKFIGSSNDSGVCDVYALSGEDNASDSQSPNRFYAVYRDGTLRAWNTEEPRAYSVSLSATMGKSGQNLYEPAEERQYGVRAMCVDRQWMVVVAASTSKNTVFHVFRDSSRQFVPCQCFFNDQLHDETLVDFGVVCQNGGDARIYAMWNSNGPGNEYVFKYLRLVDFTRQRHGSSFVQTYKCWNPILKPFTSYKRICEDATLSGLKQEIFDSERHPFDVVYRAVNVACKGTRCDCPRGDWSALFAHVETYVNSPQFEHMCGDRGRSLRANSKEPTLEKQKRFLNSIMETCVEIEQSAHNPVALFLYDVPGAYMVGVIQQDRFSVVRGALPGVQNIVTEVDKFEKMLSKLEVLEDCKALDDVDSDYLQQTWPLIPSILKSIENLVDKTPAVINFGMARGGFGGHFVADLVATWVRDMVREVIRFTKILEEAAQQNGERVLIDLSALSRKFEFVMIQTELKIKRGNWLCSLGNWALAEGLIYAQKNGVENQNQEVLDDDSPEFNAFVDKTVEMMLGHLWPGSTSLILPRMLAQHRQFEILKKLVGLMMPPGRTMNKDLEPALVFYQAVAYSGLGQPQRAMKGFLSAAEYVDMDVLADAVAALADGIVADRSRGTYYTIVIRILHEHRHSEEVVQMAKKAIEELPAMETESKSRIYATLFNHLVNRGSWSEALLSIRHNTDVSTKRTTLKDLLARMLYGNKWSELVELNYGELEEQAESFLKHQARIQDVTTSPHLFELLYSFHCERLEYSKAARVMYEFAWELSVRQQQTPELLKRRAGALAVAVAILEMLPAAERFLFFNVEVGPSQDEEMSDVAPASRTRMQIIDQKSLTDEWLLTDARVQLLSREAGQVPPIEVSLIIRALINVQMFDLAFQLCRQFGESTYDVLYAVARECVVLDLTRPLNTPEWTRENRIYVVHKGVGDHWSICRGLVDVARRDDGCTDSRPLRAVTEAVLGHGVAVPGWLHAIYVDADIGDYVRCLIDYDEMTAAVGILSEHVEEQFNKIKSNQSRSILPYSVIEDALKFGKSKVDDQMMKRLESDLKKYSIRIDSFEAALKYN